jgi:riboflavin kinase/FMN adenylyltransferase
VVAGHRVGRTIGFPTANLQLPAEKTVPANGVYAVRIEHLNGSGKMHYGMLNIGYRPTLDNGENRTIEVHIFDYESNLYGHRLRLHLDQRIREEQTFDSVETLRRQLIHDKDTIQQLYTTNG